MMLYGIDAVYITLPNTIHVECAKKVVVTGKYVLTEKPIVIQAQEIDGLIILRSA